MMQAFATLWGTRLEFKDWVAFFGLFVALIAFVGKLTSDTRIARYRETVAFLEKRDADLRRLWKSIQRGDAVGGQREDDLHVFFAHLELVSLLIQKHVFDEELVYNFWWLYFDRPLENADINRWIQLSQESDGAILEHYLAQCTSWANRLDREQRRGKFADRAA